MKTPLDLFLVRYELTNSYISSFLFIPPPSTLMGSSAPTGSSASMGSSVLIPCLEKPNHTFPDGTYSLRLTWSNKFNRLMPEIMHVPATPEHPSTSGATTGERSGIRIHLARTTSQLSGCVGLRYDSFFSDYDTQLANLNYLISILQSYEITLHIFSIPLMASYSPVFDDAGICDQLLRKFTYTGPNSLRIFFIHFRFRAESQLRRIRLDSAAHSALRDVVESLYSQLLRYVDYPG